MLSKPNTIAHEPAEWIDFNASCKVFNETIVLFEPNVGVGGLIIVSVCSWLDCGCWFNSLIMLVIAI